MTTIRSASRSASSRYWVVSRIVVPAVDQVGDELPHAEPAARVEPGGRLVEEQTPAGGRSATRRCRAAGAYRRSRSWPGGAPRRRGRSGRAARRPGRARRAWAGGRAARPSPGSRSRSGTRRRRRTGRSGRSRRAPRRRARTTSRPTTSARPASARSRVVRIRTTVVLPAPLGPRSPSTVPSGTDRSTPSRATVAPKRFTSPSTTIASVMTGTLDRIGDSFRPHFATGVADVVPSSAACSPDDAAAGTHRRAGGRLSRR